MTSESDRVATEDYCTGFKAFLAKQKPQFKGRREAQIISRIVPLMNGGQATAA